ncbi:MAG: hypothetical protein ABWY50_10055 [Aeromicrobium sp.]
MSFRLSHVPLRLAAGTFILNSGLSKWSGDAAAAQGVHGFAATAYPAVNKVEPPVFLKAVAAGEIALGAALLTPFVSSSKVGAGLVGFSGGLLGLYAKVPGMRDGIRPTEQGTPVAKDVWLLGIGASLLIDGTGEGLKVRKAEKKTAKAELKAEKKIAKAEKKAAKATAK